MKKLFYIAVAMVAGVALTGCNLDSMPDDELSSAVLLQDESGAEYVMDGCYALLKDQVEYLGYASGNDYCRHYFQMSEFPADNVCLSAKTTDPLYEALAYMMTDNLKNVGTLWMLAYKVIYMSNTVIENLDEGDAASHQLLGEAYFMRGMMHLHMVTLYAKPYTQGRGNMGVPLRISTNSETTTRNSVGEVYDQIVKDLDKASTLLGEPRVKGNYGYPSRDAALGLLSRVYLYMEENAKVIETVNKMLGGATPDSKLVGDFATYFANAKTSPETLFCIAHETTDDKGQASVGSMFNGDGGGWGEIYPSVPLLYLYERYPMDVRYTGYIVPQYPPSEIPGMFIYFADPESPEAEQSGRQVLELQLTEEGDHYYFMDGANKCIVEQRAVHGGEYKEWHVVYRGEDCVARVHGKMKHRTTDNNPAYFVTKFGYQDGIPTLSSPVYCRWGEVILNAAEAYAKTGKDAEALAYVNAIRTRAGIPSEGLFNAVTDHGYTSALEIVLDERRMELAFEGHRMFDVYRNKQDMDRRFPGAQPWNVVPYTYEKIQYPIPNSEWTVSGIQQNPTY
ncbi:MAG: RagB/SusD family nutrient uptake outer membrane protein [Paludibacteraceae bacterium]|nr:RagB/SusD family nutrient uptake outer membrane protein [Paludibacteraceae bacterium]